MLDAPEVIEVESAHVACDGGGVLGHPLVYLNMGQKGWVECGYCDRKFVLRKGIDPATQDVEPAGQGH